MTGFTPVQRRVIILMGIAVIIVLAMLAGFVVTSLQGWENLSPVETPSPFPTSVPSTFLPTLSPSSIPAPTSAPEEEGIWSQVQAARLFDQIAHQVETMRDLSPRAEVPLSFLDKDEMLTLLRRFYAGHDLETPLLSYAELGLLPDVPIYIRPRQASGIYVSEQEQLYVVTGRQGSGPDDQSLLAHAYVHALQDQHFDLQAMDDRAATTDASLAIRAFVEGDAMLLTAFYRYQDLEAADWEYLLELVTQVEQPSYGENLDDVAVWERLQRFPYWQGRLFADMLFQSGGWGTINSTYVNPPRSTEHVLHPERYLEGDEPTQVVVPNLGAVLGEDWDVRLEDTIGEFVTGLYLEALLPKEMAWQAADGWDGDAFVVWEHENGERLLVWRTIWDTTDQAIEFEDALSSLVTQQYLPALPVHPPKGLGGQWWETDTGAVCVLRVARYVGFVQAPDIDTLTNVVEMLP
ncbi:MAG: hypothetical protein GY832_44910 [Chloroflexi bacterium]|nr:hypothetical protein [Chloroflexota bacterium]